MTTKELIEQYVASHAENRWMDASELEALLTEFAEEMRAKQVVAIKCEKKSPITGGEMQLMQEKSSVKFRGEEISFIKKFYHCVDSGQDFTDTELDNDNMWAIFRAYWERRGFEHFYDIDGYRKEQEPASEDLEKEIDRYFNTEGIPVTAGALRDTARHFAQWQKEQMMKDAIDARVIAIGQNAIVKEENEDDFRKGLSNFQDGEKVKVIIIKNE